MECDHKWVDMEDDSNEQICVRCRKFQMQAQMVAKPIPPIESESGYGLISTNELHDLMVELSREINRKTRQGSLGQSLSRSLRR